MIKGPKATLAIIKSAELLVLNSFISENIGKETSFGIYAKFSKVNVRDSTFSENSGEQNAISLTECIGNFSNVRFLSNSAKSKSAGIFSSESVLIEIRDCLFHNHLSKVGYVQKSGLIGNFINSVETEMLIIRSTFINGIATSGGAIFFSYQNISKTRLRVVDSVFTNKTAMNFGGVLHLEARALFENIISQNNTGFSS